MLSLSRLRTRLRVRKNATKRLRVSLIYPHLLQICHDGGGLDTLLWVGEQSRWEQAVNGERGRLRAATRHAGAAERRKRFRIFAILIVRTGIGVRGPGDLAHNASMSVVVIYSIPGGIPWEHVHPLTRSGTNIVRSTESNEAKSLDTTNDYVVPDFDESPGEVNLFTCHPLIPSIRRSILPLCQRKAHVIGTDSWLDSRLSRGGPHLGRSVCTATLSQR